MTYGCRSQGHFYLPFINTIYGHCDWNWESPMIWDNNESLLSYGTKDDSFYDMRQGKWESSMLGD